MNDENNWCLCLVEIGLKNTEVNDSTRDNKSLYQNTGLNIFLAAAIHH